MRSTAGWPATVTPGWRLADLGPEAPQRHRRGWPAPAVAGQAMGFKQDGNLTAIQLDTGDINVTAIGNVLGFSSCTPTIISNAPKKQRPNS